VPGAEGAEGEVGPPGPVGPQGPLGATFPLYAVVDDFNRNDESPLKASTWRAVAYYANRLKLTSSAVAQVTTPSGAMAWNTPFDLNFNAYVRVPVLPNVDTSFVAIDMVVDPAGTGDGFRVQLYNGSGNFLLYLYRITGGATVGLSPAPVLVPIVAGNWIGIERYGTTIRTWLRAGGVWTKVQETIDTSSAVPLYPTLVIDGTTVARLDDFGGGPVHGEVPANVALTDASNTFAERQYIKPGPSYAYPQLCLTDTTAAANQQKFRLVNAVGRLYLQPMDDAETTAAATVTIDRTGLIATTGAYVERNRAAAMGEWQDEPFSAAKFSGQSPLVWTVGSAAIINNRYSVVGKTLFWQLYLSWYSGANVLSGSPNGVLFLTLPGGFTCAGHGGITAVDFSAGIAGMPYNGMLFLSSTAGNYLQLNAGDNRNFALTDIPGLVFNITIEIA
jgi:hypothetical protein